MGQPAAAACAIAHRWVGLASLGGLAGAALGLFCGPERRALAGVAGLVDWRLDGALSHAQVAGLASGAVGEILLVPAHGRLAPGRIFLFGLGPADGWDEARLRAGCELAAARMRAAGAQKILLGAPACGERPDAEAAFAAACLSLAPPGVSQVLSAGPPAPPPAAPGRHL